MKKDKIIKQTLFIISQNDDDVLIETKCKETTLTRYLRGSITSLYGLLVAQYDMFNDEFDNLSELFGKRAEIVLDDQSDVQFHEGKSREVKFYMTIDSGFECYLTLVLGSVYMRVRVYYTFKDKKMYIACPGFTDMKQ